MGGKGREREIFCLSYLSAMLVCHLAAKTGQEVPHYHIPNDTFLTALGLTSHHTHTCMRESTHDRHKQGQICRKHIYTVMYLNVHIQPYREHTRSAMCEPICCTYCMTCMMHMKAHKIASHMDAKCTHKVWLCMLYLRLLQLLYLRN